LLTKAQVDTRDTWIGDVAHGGDAFGQAFSKKGLRGVDYFYNFIERYTGAREFRRMSCDMQVWQRDTIFR